ncbi:MAG: hypothetical protein ACXVPY_14495, partial [Bacteroidia bacterium]
MSTLLNSYPIFENNQVLTSSQLNELVAYLDEQNRLTRVKLIGDGIACGFDLNFNNSVTPYELTIFQGMGITSAGFLITEGDCVVRRYRPYTLPKGATYIPFQDPDTTVQDVTLWELLTDDAPTLPSDVIQFLNVPTNFVNDKVVLLFLEILDVDLNSCLAKSCDAVGIERTFNLRKLLINKADLDKVIARTCTQANLFPDKYDLPEIFMKRALFTNDPPAANTSNYFVFSQTYINALRSTAQPATGVTIYDQLVRALKQTYIDFSPILSDQYGGVNPFASLPSPTWTSYMNGISAGPKYLGMQYFYDFIKDLILAYNEFRDVAFDLMSECCIDMDCFPQHLMLGEVIPSGSCKPSKYRHYFTTSPIFNNQKEKLARAISLFQRMVLMTREFDLPTINNPSTTIIAPSTLAVPVFITPSNEKRDPLSKRAIPYYYRIHEPDTDLGTLEQSWDYNFKLKCLFSKGLAPLAYGNQDILQSTDQGPVKTPLFYDDDPYNFFRIEGGIRGNVVSVENQINKIINDFDLPIKVISLRLSGDSFDDIAERCNFDDLRTEYGTIRIELISLLKNVFDRFGVTGAEGRPALRSFPLFLQLLTNDSNTNTAHASINQPQIGVTNGLTAATSSTAISSSPATSGTLATDKLATAAATAVLESSPVFAPLRTMAEVKTKLSADLLTLLDQINLLITELPFNITDFKYGYTGTVADTTPGFIQNYFTALQAAINVKVGFNQMLDLILRTTKIKNTPELFMDLSAYWAEVAGLLERFITDPKFKSLTFVNYSLQYRINQLKAGDMTLFSNFIKKHPGVEHKAGVQPGGTFILVYPGNNIAVDPVKRNFVVSQISFIKDVKLETARIMAKPVRSVQDNITVANNNALVLNYNQIALEVALPSIPIQKIAIEADQVIADFSLPYLCCCDCECEDLTHPTTAEELGIPALAVPFYAEYSLGDYAFGKDIDVAVRNSAAKEFVIDIVPMLQYNKQAYEESQVQLYLVNKFGNKLPISMPSMPTANYPNEPNTGTARRGVVTVASSSISKSQVFLYTFTGAGGEVPAGIDSFYYMFEIVTGTSDNLVVLERSTM